MSRIAPDIPELQHVPDALRSIVYMQAFNTALRSPPTWTLGAAAAVVDVGIGAVPGRRWFGANGAFVGAALGASAALWGFFKVIVPWRTRRALDHRRDD